jgi:hypothetical protein
MAKKNWEQGITWLPIDPGTIATHHDCWITLIATSSLHYRPQAETLALQPEEKQKEKHTWDYDTWPRRSEVLLVFFFAKILGRFSMYAFASHLTIAVS